MSDSGRTEATPLLARGCLAAIAVSMLPVGIQATLTPRWFFDDFPLGQGWIEADGALYNEHLVRDVGLLFLALIAVTGWTVWRATGAAAAVSVAWLVQGSGHLWYHGTHLEGIEGLDRMALIGSLTAVPALAGVALWASVRARGMRTR